MKMSDVMLLGILRMPPDCWDNDSPIDFMQRHSRYCQAADRIEEQLGILRHAVLAMAAAAERDQSFQSDYEKLDAAVRKITDA
jgi:hypothetical protein